jgi:hypothetical protein
MEALGKIRKMAESLDRVESFNLHLNLCGGFGSGMSTHLLEDLN